MKRRAMQIAVSAADRELLRQWSRSRTLAARVVLRSRIVLMLAEGVGVNAVAKTLGVAPGTVRLWKRRFHESGPDALLRDMPGRGRKPALDAHVRQALRTASQGGDRPSVRSRARELGVSASTISRWRRKAG